MAKGRKPAAGRRVPGEKKSPGRERRLAESLRENLKKRKSQRDARRAPGGK